MWIELVSARRRRTETVQKFLYTLLAEPFILLSLEVGGFLFFPLIAARIAYLGTARFPVRGFLFPADDNAAYFIGI